jgi:hypothetical protein
MPIRHAYHRDRPIGPKHAFRTGLRGATIGHVTENPELLIRLHPMNGEDITLVSRDFAGPDEALETVSSALDERRSLVLGRARYERDDSPAGVVINLANVVVVRVSGAEGEAAITGQYL